MENQEQDQMTALIIGASSGIGHHTAIKLADKGYRVFNASRNACCDERVENIEMDVERSASVNSGLNEFLSKADRLDILIYSAGYSMAAPVEYAKYSDVKKLFEINYFGAVRIVQKLVPYFREQGFGRIMLVSSIAADVPIAFDSFYSSSKAALDMLAKGLSIELEPFGVKAVSVQPGGTSTRFTFKRNVYPDDKVGVYAERMRAAVQIVGKKEQSGMSPASVADCIVGLAEAKNPPEVAVCGFMNKTYKLIQKLLPERLGSYINKTSYRQDTTS